MKYNEVCLADVCDLIAGYAFKSKDFGDFDDKVIKITHITPPIVDMNGLSGVDFSKYNREKLKRYIAKSGDYVLAMTGATIGKIGRIVSGEAYINQRVLLFKNKDAIDKDFLYYVLLQHDFEQYVYNHIDSESAQPNISATTIGKYIFSLPPMSIQQKIGRLLRSLDEKCEVNNAINHNLEQQIKVLYANYFVDTFNTEWPEVPLSKLILFQEGPGIRNWQYVDDGVKFINIRCINNGSIDTSTANKISREEAYGKYKHFLLEPYDIVMSCSGTLGRYAIVQKEHLPLCLNTSVIRFKPRQNDFDYSFVYGYMTSTEFLNRQLVMANGSAQVNFGPTHLKQIRIKEPPVELRKQFNYIVMPIINSMIAIRGESTKLALVRDALLPKLMSGEIDVSKVEI